MKKLLLALPLLLTCIALHADAPPPAPPNPNQVQFSMPVREASPSEGRQIRFQIEVSDNDIKDYGLTETSINSEIMTRLQLAQIQVKDDSKLPELLLRIKSIQADRAIATFIQLTFYEEALLKRNNNSFQALTWSQASLISCAKEELAKQVDQIVIQMINSFILDYQKALAPQ